MSECELKSSFLEYNGESVEIVYSDDHPDFVYTPKAHPDFILFSHQLFAQVIQEQPLEELFEAENDTELSPLKHLQI